MNGKELYSIMKSFKRKVPLKEIFKRIPASKPIVYTVIPYEYTVVPYKY